MGSGLAFVVGWAQLTYVKCSFGAGWDRLEVLEKTSGAPSLKGWRGFKTLPAQAPIGVVFRRNFVRRPVVGNTLSAAVCH